MKYINNLKLKSYLIRMDITEHLLHPQRLPLMQRPALVGSPPPHQRHPLRQLVWKGTSTQR